MIGKKKEITTLQENKRTKFKNRSDILEWYFISWYYDWCKNVENDLEILKNDLDWRIFHKACYGYIIVQPDSDSDILKDEYTITGLSMEQYFKRYEKHRRQKLKTSVKRVMKQLATDTLFCECCYRSFSKDNIRNELTTPYIALLDIVSAISFVIFPVAWIPLIAIFSIFALKDAFFGGDIIDFDDDDDDHYSQADFDSEYFPQRYDMMI
eukprot:471691_1